MKILVVGAGGREHALSYKVAQSSKVETVFVAPGNAGTAQEAKCQNVDIAAEDIHALLAFAQENQIDMTIVGPEAPLVLGITDLFEQQGLKIFGPRKAAAQLEGSKSFSKDFLARHAIPTAAYAVFEEIEPAIAYVKAQGAPIVVKADGLAAGKGVIVAETEEQAINAIQDMLADNKFGDAGSRVVIEEFLEGEEASFIVMADGTTALPFATSQDHKRVGEGDTGLNTGGMGAYSPAPVVTDEIHKRIMDEVINPTMKGMFEDGMPYTGFLYAGLMITKEGAPKVIEFNCRFGDPETQPIMLRLESDLVELVTAALHSNLHNTEISFTQQAAVGVVLAAGGYPEAYQKGLEITGFEQAELLQGKIFHAGTKTSGECILTNGGRVLCATALGNSVTDAQKAAYQLVDCINWEDIYYRNDIAWRAIAREA
ncbi:phosphoribosylamine--glycine ligase [Planctobacterium marinum]|uniref:Phosphoribosylamine--glycine ligase n=1 Tax=Planctobacterium marinum TaxID=1631968 RepID=A0AA48KQP2_9ALTE|nr:phosphoribosylamine--glycine ligase [Planctobacterium marinum]